MPDEHNGPDDATVSVKVEGDHVVVTFSSPVTSMALTPASARELARRLTVRADQVK